nr:hypothetical protein [Tanacetum cinerariifolium]
MSDLQFIDQHNMVACSERTNGNDEFHQIVDFLTSSTIHYALTLSPTIYTSYIKQFWATAKSKTVNDVKQIHAKVDGKKVVISKSLVRSDLHYNDEDVTPLFDTILVPPVVEGEGSRQPSEPQPPSSTTPPEQVLPVDGDEAVYTREDDRVVRVATTASSLEAEQESGTIDKSQPTTTLNEPSHQGTGSGSEPRRHVTTLGDTDAQTRFESASKHSYDPPLSEVNTFGIREDSMEHQDYLTDFIPPTPYDLPLSGGHTPGSDEGRPNINELMNICNKLSNKILALEQFKTTQHLVIKRLKKKVKRLEKKQRARTPGMKLFKIGTSKKKTLNKENDVNATEHVSTAGDAVNAASVILNVSAVGPSTIIHDVKEEPRRATPLPIVQSQDKGKGNMVEPEPISKNPIKAQIQRDAEIAQRLFKEEQAQFERANDY